MQGNKVILVGYVGKEIFSRNLESGNKMVSIRLATHYKQQTRKDEWITHTEWHDIIAWNEAAVFAERSFVKGSRVMVEGSIVYRTYPDKSGDTRYITQIRAQSIINLDR